MKILGYDGLLYIRNKGIKYEILVDYWIGEEDELVVMSVFFEFISGFSIVYVFSGIFVF